MLYDNGQLIGLYSEAYQAEANPLYKNIVLETIAWAKREMQAENGGFYAALDADSEGVEGKFYTFTAEEFDFLEPNDAAFIKQYYNITAAGNWEEEQTNIPFVNVQHQDPLNEVAYSSVAWNNRLTTLKNKLLSYRASRVRPGLDNKQLTSWNALFLSGLVEAYRVFQEEDHLHVALQIASFITNKCSTDSYLLHQPQDSNRRIEGFLDDYAFTIEAFTALYEATFEESWLFKAQALTDKALLLFYDKEEKTFFYTANNAEELIARKSEIMDNVIPASSSTFVRQLYKLGLLMDNTEYTAIADQVFANVFPHIKSYGSAYSNWAIQLLAHVYGTNEIALTGKDAFDWRKDLDNRAYIPNKITLGGTKSTLPLLVNRKEVQSKAYLCKNRTCSLPQKSITDLIELINENEV